MKASSRKEPREELLFGKLSSRDLQEVDLENRLNFSFVIENRLAGLAFPRRVRPDELWIDFLERRRVSILVNLTEYQYDAGRGLEVLHFQVPDFGAISLEDMDEIWERYLSLPPGKAMAVHCLAGRGRTGMVLACIVARQFGMPPLDAVFHIRALRPGSIETGVQEELVEEWIYTRLA